MITVSVSINGNQPVFTRTAVNRGVQFGKVYYELDDGTKVIHDPRDGAVVLAIKMLGQIREQDIKATRIEAARQEALHTSGTPD